VTLAIYNAGRQSKTQDPSGFPSNGSELCNRIMLITMKVKKVVDRSS
jgi:hypothetical protein